MHEIYELRLIHYMEDCEGNGTLMEGFKDNKTLLEEPIVCKSIYERNLGNHAVLINEMLDKMKDYVLARGRR